jgi:hypothetical protein
MEQHSLLAEEQEFVDTLINNRIKDMFDLFELNTTKTVQVMVNAWR